MNWTKTAIGSLGVWLTLTLCASAGDSKKPVDYHKDIRPILQANCHGCHQPARAQGGYVMTDAGRLRQGGDSGEPSITPSSVGKSELLARIKGAQGHAIMPPGDRKKLSPEETALIEAWIEAGAIVNSPATAHAAFDTEHPPIYSRPPFVSAIDVSPDGKLIAVAGFHEILLHKADGSGIEARLVGLSERIEAVKFSPDGKLVAASGGLPARMGEIQVWDVAKKELKLSAPITADTLFGASWSPDGKRIAFGCADGSTVRVVDAVDGRQLLYQGAHSDWVLDTVFSVDGSHLVSVGRDRACKLIEVGTQRFVDNITSITPGALKGGILAVDRHPARDEVAVGCSDGAVKVYRMHRLTARAIGDDSNLIREMPQLAGRVWSVAVSRDGKRIVAGASLDGKGEVGVFGYEFDTKLPDAIKAIEAKVATSRSAAEKKQLAAFHQEGVKQFSKITIPSAVYAVAFMPDGQHIVAAGADGVLRLFETDTGRATKEWPVAPRITNLAVKAADNTKAPIHSEGSKDAEKLPAGVTIAKLEVQPSTVKLGGPYEYAQLLVTGITSTGERIDLTRQATYHGPENLLTVQSGLIRPIAESPRASVMAFGQIDIRFANLLASVPVDVGDATREFHPDFIRDVNPVLSRVGCNAGTCHGSKEGKNGFKLSLRGYDPIYDIRALTDDHASRRVSVASPDDSLMLLKTSGVAPHVGGQLVKPDDPYYQIMRSWVADGAKLNLKSIRVSRIVLQPAAPVIERIGERQQFRVVAEFADGQSRDVTREAFIESGNSEVLRADKHGLTTALRRGEAPILARYEGAYAAATLTVMGDRTGFAWKEPARFNRIDELTSAKWQRLKIQPSELCNDADFLRRVTLDLTGMPPTVDAVRTFLADQRNTQAKRNDVIDRLVGSPEYVEHWTNKWADLLQVNRKFLGAEGSAAFRKWIREQIADNIPYDRFAKSILTASGSNREHPAASYFKVLRQPAETMENTTHLFLAVRFNCNKCHDHPFERWTQDQYYQTAAFFAQIGLKADPASGNKSIGGTDVEAAKPLYEEVFDAPTGDITHDRTGAIAPPTFPYPAKFAAKPEATRREQMAAWMISPDNQYFAKSYVNRMWGYMFGFGIIEPIDDIRAGNPPSNPELLDFLTSEFINSGFNVRHLHRLIAKSRTYQLAMATNKWNEDDKINCSHALARRLPAEVIFDAVHRVTGTVSRIPGLPAGTRAAELPDSGIELPGGFLNTLGRPPRESACECERTHSLQLGPVMALVSGQVINDAIADPSNDLARLVATQPDDAKLVDEIFMRIINRPATPTEIKQSLAFVPAIDADHQRLAAVLAEKEKEWSPTFVRLQEERDLAVETARKSLEAYKIDLAPRRAQQEIERKAAIANAESALRNYDAELEVKQIAWEKKTAVQPDWTVLRAKSLKASNKAILTQESDGSIFVAGPNGAGEYTVTLETDLTGITAVRLEALSDPRLPSRGPGRAMNGNFVLNEFVLSTAAKSAGKVSKPAKFKTPLADFSQASFPIANAINGPARNSADGWAIVPRTGQDHWATLELDKPIGHEGGTLLTFKLHQNYVDKTHSLGRFRISVTTAKQPVGLSLPDHVVRALAADADNERTIEQANLLAATFRQTDLGRQSLATKLDQMRMPLPPDAKLESLKYALAQVEKPVPLDPKLVQLRADAKLSAQQQQHKRLTAAQDLAWALINSPAFLFNR